MTADPSRPGSDPPGSEVGPAARRPADPAVESGRSWFRRLVGRFRPKPSDTSLSEALSELIEDEEVTLAPEERHILSNLTRLGENEVSDVMVPRAHILAADEQSSLDTLVAMMSDHYHSRLPIYKGTPDRISGMIHIKDVLSATRHPAAFRLQDILRPVLFISPTMKVLDLLLDMRDTRIHMAIIVDEFGGTYGLVTIEDMIEAIVGDIEDEHDTEKRKTDAAVERPDGSLDLPGATYIDDFEAQYGAFAFDDERENVDTLGGLAIEIAGHVPRRGEWLTHGSGMRFEVLDADERRVKRLRLRRPAAAPRGED